MSKVKIQGNASGTGVVTLTAPNTNTDRTITLPDGDISLGVGIDDNATSTAITIDASENVTVGGILSAQSAVTTSKRLFLVDNAGTSMHNALGVYVGETDRLVTLSAEYGNSIMAFRTDGAERLRIQSGGGISFNGDTAAANALDDYEEGTWTPVITGTSGGTATYYNRTGTYTKVGNLVTLHFYFHTSGASGMSGSLRLTGLPFSISAYNGNGIGPVAAYHLNDTGKSDPILMGVLSSAQIEFLASSGTGGSCGNLSWAAVVATAVSSTALQGTFTYRV